METANSYNRYMHRRTILNEFNAKALLDISNTAYSNMWSHMGDLMEWAWTSGENAKIDYMN